MLPKIKKTQKKIILFYLNVLSYISLFVVLLFFLLNAIDYLNFFKEYEQFNRIKKINQIILGYEDSSAKKISHYFEIIKRGMTYRLFNKNEIPNISIDIDYKNLIILENSRQHKDYSEWAKASLSFPDQFNKGMRNKIKIKIRGKGDRLEHRKNLNSMSFKVDIRGDDFFYGMEEFSVQKPKLRNYAWEKLLHQLHKDNDLLSLNYFPVNLSINGKDHGLYMIEESFGKELIERNKHKFGPIFSINENFNQTFPKIVYEVYSDNYWKNNNPELLKYSKYQLMNLKNSEDISNILDIDKWAKFFAINDILSTYHGVIEKSVKLYFNPVTGKFDPIVFDGHHEPGFNNFIFLDLLDSNFECVKYICDHIRWFKLFLNNKYFFEKYISHLEYLSSSDGTLKIDYILDNDIYELNNLFYSQFYRSDSLWVKGIRSYYFDKQVVYKKIDYINARLNEFTDISIKSFSIENINKLKISTLDDLLNEGKHSSRNKIYKFENVEINGKNINVSNDTVIYMKGNNSLKNLSINGPVMLIQDGGSLTLNNVSTSNLKSIDIQGTTWSGAINIVNSELLGDNLVMDSHDAEDSINVVNSKIDFNRLVVINSKSDAIDIDFGWGSIKYIKCINSGNDCLDLSTSNMHVTNLFGEKVKDKVLSSGENSIINLSNIFVSDSAIGVVSKDGSNVHVDHLDFYNTQLYLSAFTKKNMFPDSSYISINSSNLNFETLNKNTLVGTNSKVSFKSQEFNNFKNSNNIENLMYGAIYGVKTIR